MICMIIFMSLQDVIKLYSENNVVQKRFLNNMCDIRITVRHIILGHNFISIENGQKSHVKDYDKSDKVLRHFQLYKISIIFMCTESSGESLI